MQVRVVSERAEFAELATAWTELSTSDSPFQHFDWWHTYLAQVQTDQLCTLVGVDGGRVRGIAPLVRAGPVARPVCDHLTDHSLLWLGDDAFAGPLLSTLRALGVRELRGYGVGRPPAADAPATGARPGLLAGARWEPVPCPVLPARPDPAAGYRPGVRGRLRQTRARIEGAGPLELVVRPARPDTMAAFLDRLYAWRCWTGHPQWAMTGTRRAFLLALTGTALAERILIATLRAGDQHVSSQLCMRYGSTLGMWATAHEPALAAGSPGLHGTDAVIRWAAARGLAYDFLRGAEPYKARFGARTGYHVHNVTVPVPRSE